MNPSVDVLNSIDRLSGNTDFGKVVAWLTAERAQAVDSLLAQTNQNLVMQEQGYARCLHDIVLTATSARVALERHFSAKP